MGRYDEAYNKKESNPFLPVIGFVLMVILAVISFFLSSIIVNWMQTAHFALGATGIQLLPIQFPAAWSPLGKQLLVGGIMFMISFAAAMILLFMFMRPESAGDYDVDLAVMREEKERLRRKRGF